ncbi:autotransporter outer membrane beta-barrel domain-containing protein [Pseudomonas sp. ITA]|uniref:autotransporter family protein n=1 Tax=Pseudomonas sp. ITA TaxID=2825841 RepID=UPI002497F3C6|nr:autotransporter outer membrane beta-barrel domain-containing protein [Pseudomonas sp. ITA]MDI2145017.1 autotransporter outer membrane beta-barrel domain-containing protein [Pseudomonas sp. ITA]
MNRISLPLSLLAIAVATSASFANAESYEVNAGPKVWNTSVAEDLTITGGFTFVDINGDPVTLIEVNGTDTKSITNQGILRAFADGGVSFALNHALVDGNVLNDGQVQTNGPNSIGILLDKSNVSGSLLNAGSINVIGRLFPVGTPATYGILVKNSDIEGNIENTNSIFASGHSVVGLGIVDDGQYQIGGSVANSRVISVNGEQSTALKLVGADVKGGISNSGILNSSGSGARSVVLENSKFGRLVNNGSINAVAAQGGQDRGVTAIYVDNVQGYDDGQLGAAVIQNTSTISSSGVGILNTGASDLVINNGGRGTILGSIAAIDGGDHTTLNLGGGSITGDMLGLRQLNVLQDMSSIVTAKIIEADSMNIGKNAHLYLRTPQSSLRGDLKLAGGSTMDLMLADATDPSTAFLDVSGKATFDAGSAVTVSAKPGDFKPTKDGVEYVLVKAGSISDGGVAVSSSSYLLNVKQFAVDGTTVKAVVQAKPDDEIGDIENPNGGAENSGGNSGNGGTGGDNGGEGVGAPHGSDSVFNGTTGAILAMKNSILGQLQPTDPVFQALSNAQTREEVLKIAKQLTPEVNGGSTAAALSGQTIVGGAVSNRVSSLRTGLSSGDVLKETGVWAQALSNNSDQNSRGGVDGFHSNSAGIAIGADGKISDQITIGAAFSYLNTNVTSDSGDKTEVQGSAFTLYGSYEMGNWFVDGIVTAGKNDNDSKRFIVGTQAKGNYDSDLLGASVLGGYDFHFDNLVVEPRAGARYTNVKIDGFTEHGSSAALQVGGQRFEVGEAGAGVRVAGNYPLGMGSIEPEATVMAWHDFIGDKVSSTAAFVLGGSPFVTTGASPVRDSYEATLGANYRIGAVTVGASYTYQTKTDFDGQTVLGRVRWDF